MESFHDRSINSWCVKTENACVFGGDKATAQSKSATMPEEENRL
jgi:hypothetical protein